MKITFLKSAIKDLHKLSHKDQKFIQNKLLEFSTCENVFYHPKVKKLKIMDYRYRAGDFRIFFSIKDKVVVIQKIKLRNEKTYKLG